MLVSSTSLRMRLNSRPPLSSAASSSSRVRSRNIQRNHSCCSETPNSISLSIVVTHSRKPGLNVSRSATGSYSLGTVARKRLLNSMLSNSTLRRDALCMISSSGVFSIDSTLNGGITLARSGTCDLASTAPGRTAFENSPPSSCSSASHEAPQKPSLSSPVRRLVPPGQSAAA